ncbi:MAG TPA: 4Fe-4S dicluster domain-containing protein [Negativicutes bacterium]|nr:4Fe-4S dicluster domain-containing protein [Negativicutes bacterium]
MKLIEKIRLDCFKMDLSHQHVGIRDHTVCRERCSLRSCLRICPAEVYQWNDEVSAEILVQYVQCIECGACRIACPCENIYFDYPRGGFGVIHRYG